MINLDAWAGFICLILAASFFVLHALTSPRHKIWVHIPGMIRAGYFLTGCAYVWRGFDLLTISNKFPHGIGHINATGVMTLILLTYTMLATSIWLFRRAYPARVWDHLRAIERGAKRERLTLNE